MASQRKPSQAQRGTRVKSKTGKDKIESKGTHLMASKRNPSQAQRSTRVKSKTGKDKIVSVTVSYWTAQKKKLFQKKMSLADYKKLKVQARVMLNAQKSPQENRKLAAAENGSLFVPLYVQNRYKHDKVDLIIVEKDYHSGAKYIRQVGARDGKTIDFTYITRQNHVFYQRILPEPRINIYLNNKTGKKVTTWKKSGRRRTEWLKPEGKPTKEMIHQEIAKLTGTGVSMNA